MAASGRGRKRGKGGRKPNHKADPRPEDGEIIELERMGGAGSGRRGGGRTGRATEAEAQIRRLQVRKWLLEGRARMDIVQDGAKMWGLAARQMDYYIATAKAEIKASADAAGLVSLQWHIAARLHLQNMAVQAKDIRAALAIVDSLHRLMPSGAEDGLTVVFEEDHAALDGPAPAETEPAADADAPLEQAPAPAPAREEAPREPERKAEPAAPAGAWTLPRFPLGGP